jgi:predicted DNA binding CopG/RHH family protein
MTQESNDERPTTKVLMQLTDDLNAEVRRTAADLGLNLQTTIRLSLERGLPILRSQLLAPPVMAA